MDAMHYEYMGSVADAADDTARARADGIGGSSGAPAPPENPLADMEDDVYQLVRNENDGTMWACAPGLFQYIGSPEEISVAQACGVLTAAETVTNNRGIDVLRQFCLTGNYPDQPSAVVPN